MDKNLYFLISIGCFLVGVAFASYFASYKILIIAALILASFFSSSWLIFKTDSKKPDFKLILFFYFCALCLILGVLRFKKSFLEVDNSLNEKQIDFIGLVISEPSLKDVDVEYKIRPLSIAAASTGDILLKTRQYPVYNYGDGLEIKGILKKPEIISDFDYPSYLAKDNIYFLTYYPEVKNVDKDILNDYLSSWQKVKIPFFKVLYATKNYFLSSLKNGLAEPYASFVSGIILGDGSGFSKDLADLFRKVGISHIVAVSGYNVTIIVFALFALMDLFYLNRSQKFYIATLIIAVYAIICGLESSVVRAAIMGILFLIAKKEKRIYSGLSAIAAAGFLMVWVNPKILRFDYGFQLSFLATLGLIYIYPLLSSNSKSSLSIFKDAFLSTVSAQLAVLPILISGFNNFSFISILVNVLVLPFIPLAMFLGFCGGALGLIPYIGRIVLFPAYLIAAYVIGLSKFFAGLNLDWLRIENISCQFIIIYYLVLGFMIYFIKKKRGSFTYEKFN